MALLNAAGCSYLTFGYEPLTESGEIYGMPKWIQRLTRKTHKSVFQGLKVSGKKGYYDKWCPDEEQKTGLHLIFPAGTPGIQDIVAVMHFANISVRGLVFTRMKGMMTRQKKVKGAAEKDTTESEKTKRDTVESEKTKEKPTEKNTTEKPTTQTIKAEEGIVEVVSTSNQITQSTTEEMPVKEKAAKKKKQKAKKTSEKDTTENTATTADAALEVAQRDSGVEVSPEPAKEEETIELPPDASKANGTIDGELKGTIKQETDVSNEEDPPLPVRHPDHRLSEFKSETDP
jgi:sensor c-di-GMP phosphodiesterase-like protein